jgi:hypothetical protein
MEKIGIIPVSGALVNWMRINFISNQGSTRGTLMAKKSWQVTLEEGRHDVELDHGFFSGKRVIRMDGNVVFESHTLKDLVFDTGGVCSFNIGRHPCAVIIRTNGLWSSFDLAVDGRSVESGRPLKEILPVPGWVWLVVYGVLFIMLCICVTLFIPFFLDLIYF